MRVNFNSLKFKISVLALVILAVILVANNGFLFFIFRGVLYREFDKDLNSKAQHINNTLGSYLHVLGSDERSFRFAVSRVVSQTGEHAHRNKIEKLEKLWVDQVYALGLNRDYLIFLSEKGEPLARSPNLTAGFPALSSKYLRAVSRRRQMFKNVRLGKENLRILILPAVYKGKNKGIILVAGSREHLAHVLRSSLMTTMLLAVFVLGAASFLSRLFARRVLRPIDNIVQTARHIHHGDLSVRIRAEDVDVEMKDLVESLNEMMSRLERSFKYVAEFSSHVSHELKTPLAIMRGESEVVLRDERPAEEYKKVIEANLEEIARMEKIINDLLLLTRLDYEPHVFTFEEIEVVEFFKEIEESGGVLAAQKDITVKADLSKAPPRLHGDKVHLRRLFFNLINNAVKFTPSGGRIRLSVKRRDAGVSIAVSDTGVGIPKENLSKIFGKFFHFEGMAEGVPGGTGLGLSLAQSIAKIHGGDIQVESVVGKGSVFTVRLPLSY